MPSLGESVERKAAEPEDSSRPARPADRVATGLKRKIWIPTAQSCSPPAALPDTASASKHLVHIHIVPTREPRYRGTGYERLFHAF
jgi:hypothetical protein